MCELYYNQAMREHFFRSGSSSTIAGSGVLFDTATFQKCLEAPVFQESYEGPFIDEDKLLQHLVVNQNLRIAFVPEAIIFDEKVSEGVQVQNQRSRWLMSHFLQTPAALKLLGKGLLKGKWNMSLFGVSTAYPPLFVLAGISGVFVLIDLLFYQQGLPVLLLAGLIFTLNFLLSLKLANAPKEIWSAFVHIPAFVIRQVKGLLGMKKRTRNVAPTQNVHQVGIEEVMENDAKDK